MKLVDRITLCEVGPRDGLQNEKTTLTAPQRAALIDAAASAGFPAVEAGSFVSPKAVPQMAATDQVFSLIHPRPGTEYRAFIANAKGVERAAACGCAKVKLNVSASRAHNLANLNRTPEESIAGFRACVELAAAHGIEISGSISMPFGSPWEKAIPLSDIVSITQSYLDLGITELSLSDASGMAYPTQVFELCGEMGRRFPQVRWWLHFHNTRGLGIANIMAGMEAGFSRFDTSFAGVGGCPFVPGAAGNIATEDVLHLCGEMGIETGVDLDAAMEISRGLVGVLGHPGDSYLLRAGKSGDLVRELPTGQIKNHTLGG